MLKQMEKDTHVDARDWRGRTTLHVAASRGLTSEAEQLLESDADISATDHLGNTPLHYCGHVEIVNCLVANGADVHCRCVSNISRKKKKITWQVNYYYFSCIMHSIMFTEYG